MGREKGARENIFPCLLGEKMGEERKWGRKVIWAPCPIFPPTFPPKMGGFRDKFFVPTPCPSWFARCSHLAMLTKSSLLLLLLPQRAGSIDLASTHHEILLSSACLFFFIRSTHLRFFFLC